MKVIVNVINPKNIDCSVCEGSRGEKKKIFDNGLLICLECQKDIGRFCEDDEARLFNSGTNFTFTKANIRYDREYFIMLSKARKIVKKLKNVG